VNFNNTTLSGGDAGNGVDYEKGPIRNGIFATSSSSRENSGAGYYGAYELSGNLKERTITIGNSIGLSFTGLHGDGLLLSSTGNEGNADVAGWPGADAIGSGLKGGAWDDTSSAKLKISDRSEAAFSTAVSYPGYGGRGVRTYEQ
jgi:hypothetical protein